ncbi:MAG: NAD(P)/FAD-dependent oxidoreductase [Candidatus Cryptobacteroides sp.]
MECKTTDILVIGGGAAGLMAASGAAGALGGNGTVTVIEKMPRPGRKIMITGKGRCNFTNAKPWNEFSSHIHPRPDFLKPAFYNLTPEKMIEYLTELGMESVVERGDRAFPASYNAADVVDTLLKGAIASGAEVLCGKEAESCTKTAEGFVTVCKDGSRIISRKLIICTGGLSYPKTGSTGDGYRWAESMGHTIKELFPSLTAIVPKGYKSGNGMSTMHGHIDRSEPLSETGKLLCGNSLKNVELTVSVDGTVVQTEFGDLDFTDGGIEGPIGFKVSRRCVSALVHGSKVTASIDLKPAVEPDALHSRIVSLFDEISRDRRSAGKQYKERFRILLGKVLPSSLIPAFIRSNPGMDHKSLAKSLKSWKMDIEGYVGYERCVITAGGVSRDEIVPKTLESRLTGGLYFAGEVLDIDADTGGYNLQTAFSTGFLAGISAAKSLLR